MTDGLDPDSVPGKPTHTHTEMDKQKVLAKLMGDLQSFLCVLDTENLSYIAQAQKKSISQLLAKLQPQDTPVEDAEYMIMSCPSSSPINEITDTPGTEDPICKQDSLSVSTLWLRNGSQGLAVPSHPPDGLDNDDDDDDEDTYEEAEPFIPDTTSTNTEKAESDSSHYESYGEEGEEEEEEGEELVKDRAHYIQWSASQPCLRPAPESRLCGYLWRKKWLGQWTKQLFVIRNNTLLCYKCAKDLLPQLELSLRGGHVVYKAKPSKKIQHQLRLTAGTETLVLGYSSYQQAEDWRTVIEEVSGGVETQSISSLVRSDRPLSCRSSTGLQTDTDEEKPPTPSSLDNKDRGFLNVLMNCQWQSLLCQVEAGLLKMFGAEENEDRGEAGERCDRPPQYTVQLRGCEVNPGPDSDHSYRITLNQHGVQVAVLEASCSDDKERWLQMLQDGAASQNHHDNSSTLDNTGGVLSGLKTRRFPTSNMYMDDPFHLSGTGQAQPIYSNTSILEHMVQSNMGEFQSSQDVMRDSASLKDSVTYSNTVFTSHSRKSCEVERGVQKLELTGKRVVPLRAGSEMNLASAVKQNKRTSFRQSLAFCSERAQAGFLNPLLRRTASAKTSLRREPSTLFIQHGKVCQRRKEWETKAAV